MGQRARAPSPTGRQGQTDGDYRYRAEGFAHHFLDLLPALDMCVLAQVRRDLALDKVDGVLGWLVEIGEFGN